MPETRLLELHAEGVGPIDSAHLEFSPRFTVLTGETGAGKTLLIGALSLCLGASEVRGVRGGGALRAAMVLETPEGELALSRESSSGGRLRSSLDGLPSSAAALRERAGRLVVIHGQHESLRLRSRSEALALVDAFGSINSYELDELRARRRELERERDAFGGDPAARSREIEFLRFQLDEIDQVRPVSESELEEVLEELRTVTELRERQSDVVEAVESFDGDHEGAILSSWARMIRRLPTAGRAGQIRARLEELETDVRDLVHELATETEQWSADPELLERLEARATALQALARKYGGSLALVIEQRHEMTKALAAHEGATDRLAEIDGRLAELDLAIGIESERLLEARRSSATRFTGAVSGHFARVALPHARLEARVSGADGSSIELLYSPDPQIEPGPLSDLASGGELARVLLAVSLETVGEDSVAVFDEIDAGIGGNVAQQIGDCLAELATRQQVVVVTHLASIAARADRHLVIEKESGAAGVRSTVRVVVGDERVDEVARMLAGESQRVHSRALARALLAGAEGPPDTTDGRYNESP